MKVDRAIALMPQISLRWLTIACFEVRIGDFAVVIDPCIGVSQRAPFGAEVIDKADLILLSHGHWDHITDMKYAVEQNHPLVLCGDHHAEPMARWLNYTPTRIYPMYPDTELDFGPVKIRSLFGRHCDLGSSFNDQCKTLASRPWSIRNPDSMEVQTWGSLEYRNYLFTFPNGTKLLIWGNDPTVEQKNMLAPLKPDIAILQLSKQDPIEMAEFAAAIGAKVVIPHHMDLRKTPEMYMPKVETMQAEYQKLVPDGIFICPKNGEWIHL